MKNETAIPATRANSMVLTVRRGATVWIHEISVRWVGADCALDDEAANHGFRYLYAT